MSQQSVADALYQKYIQPTCRKKSEFIGIEVEMPIVNLSGEATDYGVAQRAFMTAVEHFGLEPKKWDEDGVCFNAIHPENGDDFSFDCSYNNLELSLGKAVTLREIRDRFETYVRYINGLLAADNHMLTGMGVNPSCHVNRKDYVRTGRYQMLSDYLSMSEVWDDLDFHQFPDFGAFSSASQVQLDVERDELIDCVRAFSLVEPVKAVLFSNSVLTEEPNLLCVRDMLWEKSTHGINPRNVGAYERLPESCEDLVEQIAQTSIFCVERDGRYPFFHPLPIREYLETPEVEGFYRDFNTGELVSMRIEPRPEDLAYLRSYKFQDVTYRGTIEFRSVCCQPLREALTVAAFHVGLIAKVPELLELMESDTVLYGHGYDDVELRRMMNAREWPEFVDREGLKALCLRVLDLAHETLVEKGYGDEEFLLPLYQRAVFLTSPGRRYVEQLEAGRPVAELVREFSL